MATKAPLTQVPSYPGARSRAAALRPPALGLLALALAGAACAAGPDTFEGDGDDVESSTRALGGTYDVWDLTQLNNIRNDTSGTYYLRANINASPTATWNGGRGWLPIPNFTGRIIGNNFTIDRLTINRPSETNIGFIGRALRATVTNVGFSNVNIRGGASVGAVAGYMADVNVRDSYVDLGTVTADYGATQGSNIGLFAGYVYRSSIQRSYARGTVNGYASYVGGFAGSLNASSTIYDCYARATVSPTDTANQVIAGGVAGSLNASRATNVWAMGSVRGRGSVGGLFGYVGGGDFWLDFSYSRNQVVDADWTSSGGWAGVYGANSVPDTLLHFGPLFWDSNVDPSTNFAPRAQAGHPTQALVSPTTPGGGIYYNGGDQQWEGWDAGTSTQYHVLMNVVRPSEQPRN